VAIRRTTRVGRMSGVPLEDLGVIPAVRHQMTLADLFEDNKDLIGRAAQLLSQRPAFLLSANLVQGPPRKLDVTTKGLNRLDVFINGRPHVSVDSLMAHASIDRRRSYRPIRQFRPEGYSGGTMVAARRLWVLSSNRPVTCLEVKVDSNLSKSLNIQATGDSSGTNNRNDFHALSYC
jgi:hypothetical protein